MEGKGVGRGDFSSVMKNKRQEGERQTGAGFLAS